MRGLLSFDFPAPVSLIAGDLWLGVRGGGGIGGEGRRESLKERLWDVFYRGRFRNFPDERLTLEDVESIGCFNVVFDRYIGNLGGTKLFHL